MSDESITQYASRVLFSETLEEKLRILPGAASDDGPEAALEWRGEDAPEPGRPGALRLRRRGDRERARFPTLAQLGREEDRGRLFHFFANHELLAAELMALALLRFPKAPRAFRLGLFETLREEQRHTRWYVERMRGCGIEFGSFPLSRFFWDAVSGMTDPLDYVTRLSLTFEQANLDYTRHYAAALRQVGDEASGSLLDRIYRDEIQHVGYGLRWFRKWKDERQSDWAAYRASLAFPLSPSRAKGNGTAFNEAGRREAGLDPDFVRELALFEQSKGRTPNVFWFNPDAEDAMAAGGDGRGYRPSRAVERFVRDIETLVFFLSRRDDVVLVRRPPRRDYLESLVRAGFELPEWEVVAGEGSLDPGSLMRRRRIHDLRPWAWEPRSAALLEPLTAQLPDGPGPVGWGPSIQSLFSKAEQMRRWPSWDRDRPDSPWRSHACRSRSEVGEAVRTIRAALGAEARILFKAVHAAAGRGHCLEEELKPAWLSGVLERDGAVVVEPWADRVLDFSIQYEMGRDGLALLGLCRQLVDARGRYRGTLWSPKGGRGLAEPVARVLMGEALPGYAVNATFGRELEQWLASAAYRGPVGIDAFLYRDEEGRIRHRLLCEVNPRHTMGRLTWELGKKVAPGRAVRFEIQKRTPLSVRRSSFRLSDSGKLEEGILILNDLNDGTDWVALLTVGAD